MPGQMPFIDLQKLFPEMKTYNTVDYKRDAYSIEDIIEILSDPAPTEPHRGLNHGHQPMIPFDTLLRNIILISVTPKSQRVKKLPSP
jgi:hypothetical protein